MDAAKKEIQLKTAIAHRMLDSNKSINNTMGQIAESKRRQVQIACPITV